MQEETRETLQHKVDALNQLYMRVMDGPEAPGKESRLQTLRDGINQYEKRIKQFPA